MADMLRRRTALFARLVLLIALSFTLSAQPVLAQAILRDAETETFLNEIAKPVIEAAGLTPANVQIVMIQDKEITPSLPAARPCLSTPG